MQVASGALLLGGVDDDLAVDQTDQNGTRRTHKGQVGNGQRRGRTDHGEHVGGHVVVDGQNRGDDLHVVAEGLREQRTDGAVDQAAGQDRTLAGAPLALDKAAGDLARSVEFFFVFNAQREKVDPLARLFGTGRADQDIAFAHVHKHGAASLPGVFARLDDELPACQFHLENLMHVLLLTILAITPFDSRLVPIFFRVNEKQERQARLPPMFERYLRRPSSAIRAR